MALGQIARPGATCHYSGSMSSRTAKMHNKKCELWNQSFNVLLILMWFQYDLDTNMGIDMTTSVGLNVGTGEDINMTMNVGINMVCAIGYLLVDI